MKISSNKLYMTGNKLNYIVEAHANGILAGNGPFTKKCHNWLEDKTGCTKAFLTHSCTGWRKPECFIANYSAKLLTLCTHELSGLEKP